MNMLPIVKEIMLRADIFSKNTLQQVYTGVYIYIYSNLFIYRKYVS